MSEIDWSLSRSPNILGIGIEAYDAGRKRARDQGVENALARSAQDPAGARSELLRYGATDEANALQQQEEQVRRRQLTAQYGTDPAGARQAAMQSGDLDIVKVFNGLDLDQRTAAEERMELFAGVGNRIRTVPYEQRRAALAQLAPMLLERGITAEQLEAFDPTDANIDATIGAVVSLKDQLRAADAPNGYQWTADRSRLEPIKGGPADPAQAGAISGARRDAVVSRPMPSRARGGGRGRAGGGPGQSSAPSRSYGSGAEPEW